MPIKDQSVYPPYWKQFSLYIRKERAGERCEKCGVKNRAIGWRINGEFVEFHSEEAEADGFRVTKLPGMTEIVLTVAHLDNEGGPCECKENTGRKCSILHHVLALCQACHLALDMPKHIENRRQTLIARKDEARGLFEKMETVNA